MLTKPSVELTLFDTLSRLTVVRATKLLGPDGDRLIAAGGKYDIDIANQVKFDPNRFRLAVDSTTVTLALSPKARDRLDWSCDKCEVPCEHRKAFPHSRLTEMILQRIRRRLKDITVGIVDVSEGPILGEA